MLQKGIPLFPTLVLEGYVIARTGVQDKWQCRQLVLSCLKSKNLRSRLIKSFFMSTLICHNKSWQFADKDWLKAFYLNLLNTGFAIGRTPPFEISIQYL